MVLLAGMGILENPPVTGLAAAGTPRPAVYRAVYRKEPPAVGRLPWGRMNCFLVQDFSKGSWAMQEAHSLCKLTVARANQLWI